jgi:hypothetical protein
MTRAVVLQSGPHGRRRWAFPHHLVREHAGGVELFIRAGTTGVAISSKEEFWGDGDPAPATWHSYDVLRLTPYGAWHSVDLFFEPGGAFAGWYVNFQTPLGRMPAGFAMCDLELDIWVEPDRTWQWKDRDAFEELAAEGRVTRAQRDAVEAEAAAMIRRVEAASPPFDGSRGSWRPDPGWGPLALEQVEGGAAPPA